MTSARTCLFFCALAVLAGCADTARPVVAGGEPDRGRAAIQRYGCTACHSIAGFPSSWGANVGPPLSHLAARGYLAGVLPNTPDNLVRWLRDPTEVDPRTAMPDLGLSAEDAADIAAYLYSRD